MNSITRKKMFSQLSWDYNFSVEEIEDVLLNRKKSVAHYTRQGLFRKLIETFPWFTVIEILPLSEIKTLLDDETINQIRSRSLRKQYDFIKKRLQQTIPFAG